MSNIHPLSDFIDRIRNVPKQDVIGKVRLGEASFDDVPAIIDEVLNALDSIIAEPNGYFNDNERTEILDTSEMFAGSLERALEVSPGSTNFSMDRDEIYERLIKSRGILVDRYLPRCIRREFANELKAQLSALPLSDERIDDLSRQLTSIDEESKDILNRSKEIKKLEKSLRAAAALTSANKLSRYFSIKADRHGYWALGWAIAVGIAIFGTVRYVTGINPLKASAIPKGNAGAHVVITDALAHLVVIGLALYIIRILGVQLRAQIHLRDVAKNRTSALETFKLLYDSVDQPDAKNELIRLIAESVFRSDDSGMGSNGDDHVTLIERIIPTAVSKAPHL